VYKSNKSKEVFVAFGILKACDKSEELALD